MRAANTVERDASLYVQIAIISVVLTDLHDASNICFVRQSMYVSVAAFKAVL